MFGVLFLLLLLLPPSAWSRCLNGMLIYSRLGSICSVPLTHHNFPCALPAPQWLCTFPPSPPPQATMRSEASTPWMTKFSVVQLFPERREVPHHITADKFLIFSVRLVRFTSISCVGCAKVRARPSEALLLPDAAEPVMRPPAPAANNLEGIVDLGLPRVGSISQLHNSIIPPKISRRREKKTLLLHHQARILHIDIL